MNIDNLLGEVIYQNTDLVLLRRSGKSGTPEYAKTNKDYIAASNNLINEFANLATKVEEAELELAELKERDRWRDGNKEFPPSLLSVEVKGFGNNLLDPVRGLSLNGKWYLVDTNEQITEHLFWRSLRL